MKASNDNGDRGQQDSDGPQQTDRTPPPTKKEGINVGCKDGTVNDEGSQVSQEQEKSDEPVFGASCSATKVCVVRKEGLNSGTEAHDVSLGLVERFRLMGQVKQKNDKN
jgi:hypothetical protein